MANLSGTNLAAAVVPFTTEDTYPTHMAAYGKGGWRSVEDLDELNTIPTSRLEYGCVAYVKGEDKPYIYKEGNWSALDLGGGGEIVVDNTLNNQSPNPIANKAVASQFYTLEQDLKGDIEAKANQSEVDSIDTRIGTLETTITSKADKSAVEALQTAVGSKAESSEVSALSGRVDSVETELDGKVSSGDFNEAIGSINGDIAGKADKVTKQEVSGDQTISPNTMYVWGSVTALTITKGTENAGIVNNYMIRFTAGEGCVVTFSGFELDWFGGEAPTWTAGNTYEISIVDNIALWAEFEA